MPITVTGAREIVDGGWSHAGLHTSTTPGRGTELDGSVARGYQRLPVAWETETSPSFRVVPIHNPQFTVDAPINRNTWPIAKSIAFYNGAGADADVLAWLPFAIGRLPSDDAVQPTLTIDKDLVDIIALMGADFTAAGFTPAGLALLYGGRVFRGYLALHTGAPTTANELPVGAGYTRLDAGPLIGLSADPTEVVVRNTSRVRWAPSATWNAPTHIALWSDQPRGSGDLWWSKEIPLPGPTSPRLVPNANAFYDFDVSELNFDFGLSHRVGFIADSDKRLDDSEIRASRLESSITAASRRSIAFALENVIARGLTEGALETLLFGILESRESDAPVDPSPGSPQLLHPIRLYRYTAGQRARGLDIGFIELRWGYLNITSDPDPDFITFDPPFSERCDMLFLQWGGFVASTPGEPAFPEQAGANRTGTSPATRVVIDRNNPRFQAAVYTQTQGTGSLMWFAIGR